MMEGTSEGCAIYVHRHDVTLQPTRNRRGRHTLLLASRPRPSPSSTVILPTHHQQSVSALSIYYRATSQPTHRLSPISRQLPLREFDLSGSRGSSQVALVSSTFARVWAIRCNPCKYSACRLTNSCTLLRIPKFRHCLPRPTWSSRCSASSAYDVTSAHIATGNLAVSRERSDHSQEACGNVCQYRKGP